LGQDIDVRNDNGNTNFDSLQVQVDKKFAKGYQFRVPYTWQKTKNDSWQYVFNREAYHSLSGPPQWLTLSHVVDLPFGHGHFIGGQTKGVSPALIGDWLFTGIAQFQAGDLLSATMNQNTLNVEYYSQMPNCSGNPNISNPTRNHWFDNSVFSVPAAYTLGTCGLSLIKGPAWWNADLQIEKDFRITERVHLTFRWLWYNAFNVVNLGNPNTTIDNPASVVGQITSVHHTMRRTQLGLHLYFWSAIANGTIRKE
jgi:hypothetical protein